MSPREGGACCTTLSLLGLDPTFPPQLTFALIPLPAPRPASMDLCLQCLGVSRDTTRPPAAFSHLELPQTSMDPEATCSNVGLAASPVVWAGAGLTSSCARDRNRSGSPRPGPGEGPGDPSHSGKVEVVKWGAVGGLSKSLSASMMLTHLWVGFLPPGGYPILQGQ